MEWKKEHYSISTDKTKLNLGVIHHFLYSTAHWAIGRPMRIVRKSIENSLCFGLYDGDEQVGFARVVTDSATVGWICDMFILPSHRGEGLGRWLLECVMEYPDIKDLRRILLNTRDAHNLYIRYAGFRPLLSPESWLEKFIGPPLRRVKKTNPSEVKKSAL